MSALSGEWILKTPQRLGNGGGVIVFLALQITAVTYVIAIAARSRLAEGATWAFDVGAIWPDVRETLRWTAAIFGASYTALYARFAAQWRYLADLYNQIKSLEVQAELSSRANVEALADTKAGFAEDAEELHLATKPLFARVIWTWLEDDDVAAKFTDGAPGADERLELLLNRVGAVATAHERSVLRRVRRDRKRLALLGR